MSHLVTFDFFDTLVALDLHGAVSWEERAEQVLRQQFPAAVVPDGSRRLAEASAYRRRGERVSLDDIALCWRELIGGAVPAATAIADAERIAMRTSAYLVPDAAAAFASSPEAWVVSDTWHSAEFLTSLADSCGLRLVRERVLASQEVGATKSAGTLFRSLPSTRGMTWTHFGNDIRTDHTMARRAGAKAVLLETGNEHRLESDLRQRGGVAAQVASAVRRARIEAGLAKDAAPAVAGALVLHLFVDLLLADAADEKIDVLVFLGRDGFGLRQCADSVARHRASFPMLPAQLLSAPPLMVWKRCGRDALEEAFADDHSRRSAGRSFASTLDATTLGTMSSEDASYAFVDIGWRGSSAVRLCELLQRCGVRQPRQFYLLGSLTHFERSRPLIFGVDSAGHAPISSSAMLLLENLAGRSEGRHLSFIDDRLSTVDLSSSELEIRELTRSRLIGAGGAAWRSLVDRHDLLPAEARVAALQVLGLIDAALAAPSVAEASVIASFSSPLDRREAPFVAPYRVGDLFERRRRAREWPAGSAMLSGRLLGAMFGRRRNWRAVFRRHLKGRRSVERLRRVRSGR